MKKTIPILILVTLFSYVLSDDLTAQYLNEDQQHIVDESKIFVDRLINTIVTQPTSLSGISLRLVAYNWKLGPFAKFPTRPGTYTLKYIASTRSFIWNDGNEEFVSSGDTEVNLEDKDGKYLKLIIDDYDALPLFDVEETIEVNYKNDGDAKELLDNFFEVSSVLDQIGVTLDYFVYSNMIWHLYIGSLTNETVNDIKDIGSSAASESNLYNHEDFNNFVDGLLGIYGVLEIRDKGDVFLTTTEIFGDLGGIEEFSDNVFTEIPFLILDLLNPKTFIIKKIILPLVSFIKNGLTNYKISLEAINRYRTVEYGRYLINNPDTQDIIASGIRVKHFLNLMNAPESSIPGYSYPFTFPSSWRRKPPIPNKINLLTLIVDGKFRSSTNPIYCAEDVSISLSIYDSDDVSLCEDLITTDEFDIYNWSSTSFWRFKRMDFGVFIPQRFAEKNWVIKVNIYEDSNPIGEFFISGAASMAGIPPSQPSGVIAEKISDTSIQLTWDANTESDFKEYKIYRSTSSNFQVSSQTLLATSSSIEYTDNNIQKGRTYFYKITAVDNDDNESQPSDEVSLVSATSLIVSFDLSEYETQVNNEVFVTGTIRNERSIVVEGADVFVTLPELGITTGSTITDENGNFSISFLAPQSIGSYTVRVTSNFEFTSGTQTKTITINGVPEEGHDIRISYSKLSTTAAEIGESITIDAGFTNDGDFTEEDVVVTFKLKDPSGNIVDSESLELDLQAGYSSSTYSKTLTTEASGASGTYTIEVEAGLWNDWTPANNKKSFSIYVGELQEFDQYALNNLMGSYINRDINVGNYTLHIENIASTYVRYHILKYGSEIASNEEMIDNEMRLYDGNQLMVILETYDDDDNLAYFYIGTPTSTVVVSPGTVVQKVGQAATYRITAPSSSRIKSDVEILYGADSPVIDTWSVQTEIIDELEYKRDMFITIPMSAEIKEYEFWVKIRLYDYGDINTWYMKKLFLKTQPVHEIAGSSFNVNNGFQEKYLGDVFDIEATFTNNGGFDETNIPIYLTIEHPNEKTFNQTQYISLNSGGTSQDISFSWTTAGLIEGLYNICLSAELTEDADTTNNYFSTELYLYDPPPLFSMVLEQDTILNIGDSLLLVTHVTDESDNIVNDANVLAYLTIPGVESRVIHLSVDSLTGRYSSVFYPTYGGNNDIIITASKSRHRTDYDTLQVPVIVNAVLEPVISDIYLSEEFLVNLNLSNVADLHGIAFDLQYNPEILKFLEFEEGSFMNSDGNVSTQLMHSINTEQGVITAGLSRMYDGPGVNSYFESTPISLKFRAIKTGEDTISFTNIGLISSNDLSTFQVNKNDGLFNIYNNPSTISFDYDTLDIEQGGIQNLNVYVSYVTNLNSFSAEINYNNDVVELINISEGSFLNEDSLTSTILLKNINNSEGIATVGITRTDVDNGVGTMDPAHLLSLSIKAKQPGIPELTFNNVGLIAHDSDISYHYEVDNPVISVTNTLLDLIYFDVYPDSAIINTDEQIQLTFRMNHVSNITGFSGDLIFDNEYLQIDEIIKGSAWNSTDSLEISFMSTIDNENNRCIIGCSMLGENYGFSFDSLTTLFVVKASPKKSGKSNLRFENIGIFTSTAQYDYGSYPISVNVNNNISSPQCFNAQDLPEDDGGYVLLSFTPSANHKGYTNIDGYCGDIDPIDYYLIYRGYSSDFESADSYALYPAKEKDINDPDTIFVALNTQEESQLAYYWISAVCGQRFLLADESDSSQIHGYDQAMLLELFNAVGSDAAEVEYNGRFISPVVGYNRAFAVANVPGMECDFNGDSTIGLVDLALFASAYGKTEEYDSLFDLNKDGTIGLIDLALFATQYGK
ncbi:carboxypeptidase regulatory-like domain-containing protein [candidate division KSB1 bacterium]